MGYSLSFKHKEWDDDEDQVLAWVQSDPESGAATVCLNTDWPKHVPRTAKALESTAMHEMAEVLLCQVRELLLPYYSDKLINTHIHKVIRPLENLLFPVA